MKNTTKNNIALGFISINNTKGSFKAFDSSKIEEIKNIIVNDYLSKNSEDNDKEILFHWHKTMIKILKKRLLNKLINF